MLVKNKVLFDNTEVNKFIGKFQDKLQESSKAIASYTEQLAKLEADIDSAIAKDIVEDTNETALALENITAKKQNLQTALEVETKKALKIKEILQAELQKVIPEASKKMREDIAFYRNTVEKEAFKRLAKLKEEQAELLLSLEACNKEVFNELYSFNELAEFAELPRYRMLAENSIFQQALYEPHKMFTELGIPMIKCELVCQIESALDKDRNNANAEHNVNREVADREQLPPAKTCKDIDLAKFLKSIK